MVGYCGLNLHPFYAELAPIELERERMTHEVVIGGIKLLEFLFAAGLVGSVVLIILTSIEDFREVFHRETENEPEPVGD